MMLPEDACILCDLPVGIRAILHSLMHQAKSEQFKCVDLPLANQTCSGNSLGNWLQWI
jgi:hypothetical protein